MASPDRIISTSVRLYQRLLAAYPRAFQETYGAQMTQMFSDRCRDAYRRRGTQGVLSLWPAMLYDLGRNALAERLQGEHRGRSTYALSAQLASVAHPITQQQELEEYIQHVAAQSQHSLVARLEAVLTRAVLAVPLGIRS